jgi:CO dehydrogenase/acetyl-CoA synthase gamma subunit (corrinoid Fe-S protein)
MDALIPFLTVFTPSPDMSMADLEAEITRLNTRNRAIDALLQGQLEAEAVFDLLADDGIEPDEWIEVSLDNCELVVYG